MYLRHLLWDFLLLFIIKIQKLFIDSRSNIEGQNPLFLMAVSELNEDTQDQICELLENLQQIEKLKNKDMRILLDKIVRQYGGKVVNK